MTSQTMKRYIRGGKAGVETTIEKIPLEKLKLDRTNVRFKHVMNEKGGVLSEDDIEDLVWDEPDTQTLYHLIINSGGLSERPFVDTNRVVKEGNRRVVCLRRIVSEIKANKLKLSLEPFSAIECEVPVDDIAPLDMEILLARWHVKDKKPWAKLNQASHLYNMNKLRGLSYDEIAKDVGLSKGKVIQLAKSFEWTTEYMNAYKEKDVTCWSFFEELYKRKDLRSWAQEDSDNLQKFFKWVNAEKFPMAIDVRKLQTVMLNIDKDLSRKAMQEFESKEGNIKSALQVIASQDPSLNSDFFKAIKRVRQRLDKMKLEDVVEAKKAPAKRKALIALRDKLNEVLK